MRYCNYMWARVTVTKYREGAETPDTILNLKQSDHVTFVFINQTNLTKTNKFLSREFTKGTEIRMRMVALVKRTSREALKTL